MTTTNMGDFRDRINRVGGRRTNRCADHDRCESGTTVFLDRASKASAFIANLTSTSMSLTLSAPKPAILAAFSSEE